MGPGPALPRWLGPLVGAVVAMLNKRQRDAYRERVDSWRGALRREALPDEALLHIAQAVANRTHPNGPKLRRLVEQFGTPQPPAGAGVGAPASGAAGGRT